MLTGHEPINWYTPGVYPSCACGVTPNDNLKLIGHWRSLGIEWVDDHGHLIQKEIGK